MAAWLEIMIPQVAKTVSNYVCLFIYSIIVKETIFTIMYSGMYR